MTDSLDQSLSTLSQAVVYGDAYRVSMRHTLSDGEELIVFFDPAAAGGTIHIETPAIDNPQACNIDVWENPADPSANFAGDLLAHAMRYDVTPETPEATVDRVTTGNLDTSGADKTEETHIRTDGDYNTPGGEARRGLWRTIPVGETIAFVVTDQSGGANNVYGFDTVVYEGDTVPG